MYSTLVTERGPQSSGFGLQATRTVQQMIRAYQEKQQKEDIRLEILMMLALKLIIY